MSIENKLKTLFDIVLEEIRSNPDFRKRVEHAFDSSTTKKATKTRRRSPAKLDPILLLSKSGEDALRQQLNNLDIEQLKDIVAEFAMDPSRLVMKWKTAERIIDHIIETASRRLSKGDAFRTP
ncbi:MAG TPA: hypothetical protein ENI99_09265 [Sedimenticola sp.]|nr:hypothetical protein [Sedimenticola sp.]